MSSPSFSNWKSVLSHGESHGVLSRAASLIKREYSQKSSKDERNPACEDTSRAEDMSSKRKSSARSLIALLGFRLSERRTWLDRIFWVVFDFMSCKISLKIKSCAKNQRVSSGSRMDLHGPIFDPY